MKYESLKNYGFCLGELKMRTMQLKLYCKIGVKMINTRKLKDVAKLMII